VLERIRIAVEHEREQQQEGAEQVAATPKAATTAPATVNSAPPAVSTAPATAGPAPARLSAGEEASDSAPKTISAALARLPHRTPGASDGPRPPAKIAPPAPLPWFNTDPDEDTAPQPVIRDLVQDRAPERDTTAVAGQDTPAATANGVASKPAGRAGLSEADDDWLALRRNRPVAPDPGLPQTGTGQPWDAWQRPPARQAPAKPPTRASTDEIVSPAPATGRRLQLSTLALVALALVAAGSLIFALTRPGAPRRHNPAAVSPPAAAAKIRMQAVSWIAGQVSPQAVVACDPAMCRALAASGMHPGQQLQLKPGTGGPAVLKADLIVVTGAVRSMLGSDLLAQDAPVRLASFGTGSTQISVGLVAPHGPAALAATLSADVTARKESGATLLSSSRIGLSRTARSQLVAGQVDSRLLVVLARLAAQRPIYIAAFGDSGPHASPGVPLRSAELAQSRSDLTVSTGFAQSVHMFLAAQNAPYRPGELSVLPLSGRQTVLVVEYPAPSPLLLLSPRR
jgi:hypothetical protein